MRQRPAKITLLFFAIFFTFPLMAAEQSVDHIDSTPQAKSGWGFEGTVGIESNYLSTGKTFSGDNPSLFAGIRASYEWVFVEATMHTMQSKFFGGFNLELIPAVGVIQSFGDVDTYLAYRLYRYTGGTLWTGERASSFRIDELAVGASWDGLYSEIAWTAKTQGDNKETWFTLGYEHELGRFGLGVETKLVHYDKADRLRFNNIQFIAKYQTKYRVIPYVGVSFGGKEVSNESIDNKVFFGMRYDF